MAKPLTVLVVGPPHTGVRGLTATLDQHRDALERTGVRVPATSEDELFRAAVEIRREHRAWGLRRKDVEGTWARIARRATRKPARTEPAPRAAVIAHELLAGATPDQIALLLDGLGGTAVHVVVVAGPPEPLAGLVPSELDLADVLARWETAVKHTDRVHVLAGDPWEGLADLLGVDTGELPAAVHQDPQAERVDTGTLRLLAQATGVLLDHVDLAELADHWEKVVADRGYDVRGDLHAAVAPRAGARPTDPSRALEEVRVEVLRQALVEAVTEIGRLREQLSTADAAVRVDGLRRLSGAARRPRPRSAS